MFGNEFFDQWLNAKSSEILSKVEREKLSSEDMLILSLKAQVNHFDHMDKEFQQEFHKIDQNFGKIEKQSEARFEQIDRRFEHVDKRFEQVDKNFERLRTILMWAMGLVISTQVGIFLKLYS